CTPDDTHGSKHAHEHRCQQAACMSYLCISYLCISNDPWVTRGRRGSPVVQGGVSAALLAGAKGPACVGPARWGSARLARHLPHRWVAGVQGAPRSWVNAACYAGAPAGAVGLVSGGRAAVIAPRAAPASCSVSCKLPLSSGGL